MPHALRSNLTRTPRYSSSHLLAALPNRALLLHVSRLELALAANVLLCQHASSVPHLISLRPATAFNLASHVLYDERT